MKKLHLLAKNHIFFVGIGGISMSGLANLMVNIGKKVSGSDLVLNNLTLKLQNLGAKVYQNHSENNISTDVDLVVFSGAINENNPEIKFCKKNNIPTMERSEFLGEICHLFKCVISVAGTHGKTTTTAMIGEILVKAQLNPTIHVGGEVVGEYNNFRIGGNEIFVTEACEFKKSLEFLQSNIGVITNIEKDHMDCYSNFSDLVSSFQVFANNCKECIITNSESEQLLNHKNKITCGLFGATWQAVNLTCNKLGQFSFVALKNNFKWGEFNLLVMGKYQVKNALFAIAVAERLGIDYQTVNEALQNFKGVKRRNELLGKFNGVPVFADYAHHPTEISNSIANFKHIYKNVLVVFQPHTYTRTKMLKPEFTHCFKVVKRLVVFKTYPAREKPIMGGYAKDLFNYIAFKKRKKLYANTNQEITDAVKKFYKKCNVILFLGAGDLYDEIANILPLDKEKTY